MRKYINSVTTVGKSVALIISILASIYAFHKQVIVSDLKNIFITKDVVERVELDSYSRIRGEELEKRVLSMETRLHDDIILIQTDIKELLKRD